jgi:hypothetical protein
MSSNNIEYTKILENDVSSINELALKNGGNKNFTLKNFNHWYLRNPINSYSMWKAMLNGSIEGYATTNNFVYIINDKESLVALPQNVLTSEKIRGKGVFGKLYYFTEEENINTNGVDLFLTSTGDMSTPIFLNKFGYLRAKCPDILAILPNPLNFFAAKNYKIIEDLNDVYIEKPYNITNSRKKDIEYYKWRYSNCTNKTLKILEVTSNNKKIGYAFLINQKKRGIKTLIIADILCSNENDITKIIDACHIYSTKNLYLVLIMFKLTQSYNKKRLQLSFKHKFNFLVKGKSEIDTKSLSEIPLNYYFGDLDYFWE